jgi:putative hydrolase of the HAD superfamily
MPHAMYILIFDADNTLWDTNSVFLKAQIALLEPFSSEGYITNASDSVEVLRSIDQILMEELGVHEYDFRYLAKALLFHFSEKLDYKSSVERALKVGNSYLIPQRERILNIAFRNYKLILKSIPPLLPGVSDLLNNLKLLKSQLENVITILFSEGDVIRLEKIIQKFNFRRYSYFNDLIIAKKTKDSFLAAKELAYKHIKGSFNHDISTIVIGDSLKRDIIPANEAGFITIYVPSNFQGIEKPRNKMETPTFQISNISELYETLRGIGLAIPSFENNQFS